MLTRPYTFIPGRITLPEFSSGCLPGSLSKIMPDSLFELLPETLPESYPGMLPDTLPEPPPRSCLDTYLIGLTKSCLNSLPDLFPIRLLPTRLYPTTLPDFLIRPGNTSLHPIAHPTLPNYLTWLGPLQLASPEIFPISLPPWLRLILADNTSR
jgi:hypothetical protein